MRFWATIFGLWMAFGAAVSGHAETTPPSADGDRVAALLDMRIVLAQLAVTAGTNDHLTIVRAQPADQPQAIVLSKGVFHLKDITPQTLPEADLTQSGQALVLGQPLVVMRDAQLVLEPGDTIQLQRETGAFLLNFGTITADGAHIRGNGGVNPGAADFRPFVLTVGSGSIDLKASHLASLGFGRSGNFAGFAVINKGLFPADAPSKLTGNTIRDIRSVVLEKSKDVVVTGNLIGNSKSTALRLVGVKAASVTGNQILASGRHGIRVTDGSRGVVLTGNTVTNARGTSILVDRGVHGLDIGQNTISTGAKGGISMVGVSCAIVAENTITGVRQKGLSVRSSTDIRLDANQLTGNGSDGIYVAEQSPNAVTVLTGNILTRNRSGLSGASAQSLILQGNDFSQQFPRILGGDLTARIQTVADDLTGERVLQITPGQSVEVSAIPAPCTLKAGG